MNRFFGVLMAIGAGWVYGSLAQTTVRYGGGGFDGYSAVSATYALGYSKVFNTGGATEVGDTRACLNGEVATGMLDGGQTVEVSVCWGTAYGGADQAAWTNKTPVATLGVQAAPQRVSARITTLSPYTTYFYRYVAEDAENQSAWASDSATFQTFGLPDVGDIGSRYTGGGFDGYTASDAQGWIRDSGTLILLI